MSLALVVRQSALVLGLVFTVIIAGQAATPTPIANLSPERPAEALAISNHLPPPHSALLA